MTRRSLQIVLGVLIACAGCGPKESETPTRTSGPAPITPGKTSAPPTGTNHTSEAPEGAQQVSFKTSDGWTIVGDLYTASQPKGTVILLHQRGGEAKDWLPLCKELQKAGINALAIDQRGGGRSTEGPGPTGTNAPWETGPDIAAAITQMAGKGPFGIAGASYGANNALIFAASHPTQVRVVALFSPGTNYHELNALDAAKAYNGALAVFHDEGDTVAGDGPQQILDASPSTQKDKQFMGGDGHGTQLLRPNTIEETVKFFQTSLAAAPKSP